jgi:hypothetical protein
MRRNLIFLLGMLILSGCGTSKPTIPPELTVITEAQAPIATLQLTFTPTNVPELSAFTFPVSIDPSRQYLFYLHGKIIEDQGIHASSLEYGEYEYQAILDRLASYGFTVISEPRLANTDSVEYAKKVAEQARVLIKAGVPGKNITVVGASKGAGIAIYISHFLENKEINFVIIGICHPDTLEFLKENNIFLFGNVLSIYDSVDELSGSCLELFAFSEGKGIARHDEIMLHTGTGHGIILKPLDEWVLPTVQWANGK